MSIRLITKVWDDSPYKNARLILHLAMADTAHDDGTFFASQTLLAEKSRCSIEYVRLTIRDMEKRGLIRIITRGNSKGRATVYQMIWSDQLPKSVAENSLPNSDDNSPTMTAHSPTMEVQLPNSDRSHPSSTFVLPIHNGLSQAKTTDLVLVEAISDAESAAKIWWESQEIKPLGKNAWHALLSICKAAEQRGYEASQIVAALNYIGTIPSMRQMDLILRGVGVKKQGETSAMRVANDALNMAQKLMEQGE